MADVRLEKIKALYKRWLHREADEPGSRHYYESDLPIEHIEIVIKNSPEARAIEKREKAGGLEFDAIEPRLLVGSSYAPNVVRALTKEGITHILEISSSEIEYEESFKVLNLGLPPNAVMSVADMEKALCFIQDFMAKESADKLLVVGTQGLAKAPGLVALWYMANGMEEEAALTFVESRREGSSIKNALFGPWHFEAAEKLFNKD